MKQSTAKPADAADQPQAEPEPNLAEVIRTADAKKGGAPRKGIFPELRRRAMFRERHPDEPE